jgi:hypothetical protein
VYEVEEIGRYSRLADRAGCRLLMSTSREMIQAGSDRLQLGRHGIETDLGTAIGH